MANTPKLSDPEMAQQARDFAAFRIARPSVPKPTYLAIPEEPELARKPREYGGHKKVGESDAVE